MYYVADMVMPIILTSLLKTSNIMVNSIIPAQKIYKRGRLQTLYIKPLMNNYSYERAHLYKFMQNTCQQAVCIW